MPSKRLTREEVLIQFSKVHDAGKYSYPRFVYNGNKKKSIITCDIHGDFPQTPACHKKGQGCPDCAKENRSIGTTKFIKLSKEKFGENTFGYDKCQCSNTRDSVILECKHHGYFQVGSEYHLRKNSNGGCKECQYENAKKDNSISKSDFIEKSEIVHGIDVFDFSEVTELLQLDSKVKLTCKEHGHEFQQKIKHNLAGSGCHYCGKIKSGITQRKSHEDFITESRSKFPGKFEYNATFYVKACDKITLTCIQHGDFHITPNKHLGSYCGGCKLCGYQATGDKLRRTQQQFEDLIWEIYQDEISCDKAIYVDNTTKVNLTCKKAGHDFLIRPVDILKGNGCTVCKESRGEREIRKYLTEKNVNFIPQKRFPTCRNIYPLPFDFYLPGCELLIEYSGIQHFQPIEFFGGVEAFESLLVRDSIKRQWVKDNNKTLLDIRYDQDVEDILSKYFKVNWKWEN